MSSTSSTSGGKTRLETVSLPPRLCVRVHFPPCSRRREGGKTLPPAMTGCRHGGRGAFVLLVSNCPRWEDQSRSNHKLNLSIPQSLLTDVQGHHPRSSGKTNGSGAQPQSFTSGSEMRIFRAAIARRESRRSLNPAVLCGVGRSME